MVIKWGDLVQEGKWIRYLGKEWRRMENGFEVRAPPRYIQSLLEMAKLQKAQGAPTPALLGRTAEHFDPLPADAHRRYRALVGKLMWLVGARPDLSFPAKELARSVHCPTATDELNLKRPLKYIITTRNLVLDMKMDRSLEPGHLEVIVDLSWANGHDRKFTSGGVIRRQGFPLAWQAKTQAVVAQSTCEAELIAMNPGGCEGWFAQTLREELGEKVMLEIRSGSTSACKTTLKRGPARMRHFEIKELWFQEELRQGRTMVSRISTEESLADLFTKQLTRKRLEELVEMIGLRDAGEGDAYV